ncbi:hypothetical protein FIM72_03060 [Helicobacter pylori]|nr:hypothetical protein FIM72_03060 [Helicobacter pylori]
MIIIKSKFFNKGRSVMLENFKKAIFRALCLGCVLIGGGGLMGRACPLNTSDAAADLQRVSYHGGRSMI